MANIRRGFGDDLTLKNGNLGINTTTAQEKVDVVGVVKGQDLYATGVSSLTAYEGFLRADNQIVESTTLEFGQGLKSSLSGEIIVGTGVTVTIGAVGLGTAEVGVGGTSDANGKTASNIDTTDINLAGGSQIECLKVYNTFTPPNGGTNERPYAPKPGELYYNYDFKTIEFFDGYGWRQVDNTSRSGRAVFGGGTSPDPSTISNVMEYIQISTFGNALDFGDLVGTTESPGGCSSSIRGLFSGGRNPGQLDRMDYITIASAGNAIDFGNLTDARIVYNAVSSSTRGVNLSGYKTSSSANTNVIDYVELSTLGNALDFGDVTTSRRGGGDCSSPTRGIYAGGFGSVSAVSVIESLTIASKGNTVRFGELTFRGYGQGQGTCSSTVRGIFAGGNQDGSSSGYRKEISYITIASEGNATYFADLAVARAAQGKASNLIRGVFAGGHTPTHLSSIETILISQGGNALDFGDLSGIRRGMSGVSDSHGGLGGF